MTTTTPSRDATSTQDDPDLPDLPDPTASAPHEAPPAPVPSPQQVAAETAATARQAAAAWATEARTELTQLEDRRTELLTALRQAGSGQLGTGSAWRTRRPWTTPALRAWQVPARVRLGELWTEVAAMTADGRLEAHVAAQVSAQLDEVRVQLTGVSTPWEWISGARIELVWQTLHSVERTLIMSRTRAELLGMLPAEVDSALRWCARSKSVAVVAKWVSNPPEELGQLRSGMRELVDELHETSDAHHTLVRTLRNRLLASSGMALLAAASLVLVQWRSTEQLIPVLPEREASGTAPWLLLVLVMVFGMVGAFVTQLVPTLSRPPGTSPYRVPFHVGLLKVAVAPLAAVLGLTFVIGGLAGATAEGPPQALALAAVFGASAQLLTGFVDRNARDVLDKRTTPVG